MKYAALLFTLLGVAAASAQEAQILDRGADYRVVQSVLQLTNTQGEAYWSTNTHTEIGTGMHYWSDDQWKESHAVFKLGNGFAVADEVPHRFTLAANLNQEGAVVMETSDGKVFRSTPLILVFRDTITGEGVIVGQIQDCVGEQIAPNQIVYPNALDGVACSLRYTVLNEGIEQELIIQEPLRAEEFDLQNPGSARLELWTGFYESPALEDVIVNQAGESTDIYLDFGAMQIGQGKTFAIEAKAPEAPVTKRFGPIEGDARLFLVEMISHSHLSPLMKALEEARAGKPAEKIKRMASKRVKSERELVASVKKLRRDRKKETAFIENSTRRLGPGVVLDYAAVSGSKGTFTFAGDTTYYVSGNTTFSSGSLVTFEGGSVIKYTNDTKLTINCPIAWGGSSYRPVVLTAVSDHSVGEKLNTATLSGQYAAVALEINASTAVADALIKNFRINNAKVGILINGRTGHAIDHGQFVNCGYGVRMQSSASTLLRNCLFNNVTTNLSGSGCTVRGEHITANGGSYFNADLTSCFLTNSLLTAVTTAGSLTNTLNVQTNASAAGIFTTVGTGAHYLTDNTYRNKGSSAVSILSDIQKKTTYPPIVLVGAISIPTVLGPQAQRDTDLPDLGYHADPLDYCIKETSLTSTLLLTNGVALGVYGTTGLSLDGAGAKVISEGRPDRMNRLVRYNAVMEQPGLWGSYQAGMSILSVSSSYSPSPEVRMRFTDVSMLGSALAVVEKFLDVTPSVNVIWVARDCSFGNAYTYVLNNASGVNPGVYLTNNVWLRCNLYVNNSSGATGFPLAVELRNNLFVQSILQLTRATHASAIYNATDNLFDTVNLTTSASGIGNSYNGYKSTPVMSGTSGNDVVLTTVDYQSGPLGSFYYNTTPSATNTAQLLDKGSVSDSSTKGFYHYTTKATSPTSSAREGTNRLDIGFHYMTTTSLTTPTALDTDGDGVPDYLEDLNGNGNADSGESSWQSASDLGVRITITRPKFQSLIP